MPKASGLISTWNSAKYLPRCLEALAHQTFIDFKVLVLDNGSTDRLVDGLESHWPDIKIIRLHQIIGFAAANNLGARMANGKWLALLNSDAFPEPDWLEQLIIAAEGNSEFAFFASRQVQANDHRYLDGAGDAYHVSGMAWRRYYNYPTSQFGLKTEEVFSACAAAALYSREAFLQVGGFDEDFFSYLEDVDLGFRLRLQGFRCLYVPGARVRHVGTASVGTQSDFALYYWQRNFIWSFIQNMPSSLVWEALPAHLIANSIYLLYYTLRGRGGILFKAKRDALSGLPRALQKRQDIQKVRKVNSREILRLMDRGWLQPYLLGYQIRKIKSTMKSSS